MDIEQQARDILAVCHRENTPRSQKAGALEKGFTHPDDEPAIKAIIAALSQQQQQQQAVSEGFVLVPVDCIGAVRVARIAMLEKEARADAEDKFMDAAMWADAAADLKKIIEAAGPEVQP